MSFVKLDPPSRTGFRSAVDYPAVILNTGAKNSSINASLIREIGKAPKDVIGIDIFIDFDAKPLKVGLKFRDDGDGAFEKKVSKSGQLQIWLSSYLMKNGLVLAHAGDKKNSKRIICKCLHEEDLDLWVFEIPDEFIDRSGKPVNDDEAEEAEETEKPVKKKKKKRKTIASK